MLSAVIEAKRGITDFGQYKQTGNSLNFCSYESIFVCGNRKDSRII